MLTFGKKRQKMSSKKWILSGILPMCFMAGHSQVTGAKIVPSLEVKEVEACGHRYQVMLPQGNCDVEFSVQRPSAHDDSVLLSVAAAFTGEDLVTVCGDHIVGGKPLQGYADVTTTGHLLSHAGQVSIKPNSQLSQSMQVAVDGRGYLFQQCLIVDGGVGMTSHIPQAILDRCACIIYRAACVFSDGKFGVVQGIDEQYPNEFVAGLVAMGVDRALYLDMGTWAYGWYRTHAGAKPVDLSPCFDNTAHQSNWLVVKQRK